MNTTVYPFCNNFGFISIDCGAPSGTSFQDSTGIWYVSDVSYVDTGKNYNIVQNHTGLSKQATTLRSIPEGTRNCYTLWNVTEGSKYLLRATFLYGNYDGKQMAHISTPLQFDIYIDVSFWRRVNITDALSEYAYEVVTVASHDSIWVCLVNINAGTPFISSLELRPLKSDLYPYAFQNQSNAFLFRLNYGPTHDVVIRYPDDPYDRIWSWYQYDTTMLTSISTKGDITRFYDVDYFEAPKSVLQTALTPISSSNLTTVSYDLPSINFPGYYVVFHFSELQNLSMNQSRQFDMYLNLYDWVWFKELNLPYLKAKYVYSFLPVQESHIVFTLVQLNNSIVPPILNAMEVYWPVTMELQLTSPNDASALLAVKAEYQIVRNWNGDPCSPTNLSWYGVSCSKTELPEIISLNLSYFGLSGNISDSFAKLQELVYLDLSHNNLSGDIPDSLTSLLALRVLNLSGNHLNGHIPDILIKRNNAGMLLLLVDSCTNCGGNSKKLSSTAIIAIMVAAVATVAIIATLLLLQMLLRKIRARRRRGNVDKNLETQVHSETKKFTRQELADITNNFSHTIGRGGFGVVYRGYLQNQTEVAVKVSSQDSCQGKKQFLAEVRSLSLVHHKNLVTLVGYCKDGDDLAVVYEYMPRGSLSDHLRGKDSTSSPLNWRMRLNILLEAAQALDYLHAGCDIMHRDVKSSNILLGQNFEAKVSDLGMARLFSADTNSSFTLCGTPGYIDPEYQKTFQLTEKCDVYSFGVILLEIVTGEPPILRGTENIHIVELVEGKLDEGSIEDLIDSRLGGEYDVKSVHKVVELAMQCTRLQSTLRPTMDDVVMHLKDCVQMEEHRLKGFLQPSEESDMKITTSFGDSSSSAPTSR